jgi:exonuclease SbcC
MRLLSITLENFLAYRASTSVSLEGIELAVLSGENGAGKSSLLDAITWALWGEARAKTDDELLHTGKSVMTVSVEFHHDGTRYRVTRIHELKRGKKLLLYRVNSSHNGREVQIWDEPIWEPLGDGAVKSTQATINKLLKLTFDTFVHSAFLQQGKADSLMLQPPRDRKDLLVDILDLTRWAKYEKAAKKQREILEKSLARVADQIANYEIELAEGPRLQDELHKAQVHLIETDAVYQTIDDQYRQLQNVEKELEAAQKQQLILQQQIKRANDDVKDCDQRLLRYIKELSDYTPLLDSADEIETRFAELQTLTALSAQLDTQREQHVKLTGRLDAERKTVETNIANAQKQFSALKKKLPTDNLAAQLADVEQKIEALDQAKGERETLREQIIMLERELAALAADNATIHKQGNVVKERLALLESSEGALCPICRQPLDEAHKAEVVSQLQIERDDFREQYKINQARLKQIEANGQRDQQTAEALDRQLKTLSTLIAQRAKLEALQSQAQTINDDLIEKSEQLTMLQNQLAAEDYGHSLRDQLVALGYDTAYHDQIKAARLERESYREWSVRLAQARERLPALEADRESTETRRASLSERLDVDKIGLETLRDQIGALQESIRYQEQVEADWKKARKAMDNARVDHQSAQQKLAALPAIARQRDEAIVQQNNLREEQADYDELIKACGRNGVVLLIIDSALETLGDATNQLLSRLTDNQLHVDFKTQSLTKSGDLIDTLDIIINDGDMSRAYELYSGGEGFRINFAVRVALSQMLAHRAGTQLQTLVIDEGFGSQDSAGRDKLIEAINAIRSQFELILVVTHIDELREAFPIQIRVTKGANGSAVQITGYDYRAN